MRFAAGDLPPLPPLILGLFVWIRRRTRENLGANPKRLVYDIESAGECRDSSVEESTDPTVPLDDAV